MGWAEARSVCSAVGLDLCTEDRWLMMVPMHTGPSSRVSLAAAVPIAAAASYGGCTTEDAPSVATNANGGSKDRGTGG